MKWSKAPLVLWMGLCAALGACGDSTADTSRDGGDASDGALTVEPLDFSELDTALEAFVADRGLSGATAAVVHKEAGVVHEHAYGEFSVDRISLLASSSKIMSVGVLMRLSDEGLLDLDAPISNYLSEWGEHKMDITVAQLVNNSSGLVGLTDDALYAPYLCQYIDAGTLAACAEQIYTADDEADRVPPDTQFRYGGGAWQLAGGIAEVVSGKRWAQLVEDTYSTPCGMTDTGYTNQYAKANQSGDGLAYPAFFDGDLADLPETENPNIEGGGYASVGDYAKLLRMHLRDGKCGEQQVLSEAAVKRMREDRLQKAYMGDTGRAELEGYGLGWWVSRDADGVVVDPGAYGASAWLDLRRGYGAIIILEAGGEAARGLFDEAKPLIDAVFDAAASNANDS